MEKQWKNLGVDLQRLVQAVETTYMRRKFKVKTTALGDGYSIRVVMTALRASGVMEITIRGRPDDFSIETDATGRADRSVKLGLLTGPFGGPFILGSEKVREELEKLEREFWSEIEERIASVTSQG
jgi:hypothetical protein